MTAIVFNCAYNGLSIIQELGRRGVEVHALDSFRNVGTTSRYATYHSCPNPTTDEKGFIEYLFDIAPEFDDKPVLIPTNDHWASAVANHRSRLSKHYRPCVAKGETVDLLLDKRAFGDWAEEQGYPVPRTWEGDAVHDIPDDAFPIAAKPGDARDAPDMMYRSKLMTLWNRIFGDSNEESGTDTEDLGEEAVRYLNLRLEVLESRDDLDDFLSEYPSLSREFAFQEYVHGMSDSMYTVGVYANEGDVKGVFTGRKVRGYPPDIGDCKVGKAQAVPDELVGVSKSISSDLNYHGIAEFEFKRDTETGEYNLIEVNPRSWSWVGITPRCGVNLPWMAYADLTGTEDIAYTESSNTDVEVKWTKALEDLANCLYFYRRNHPEWACGPREWWRSVASDELVVAEIARDDPLPTCYSVAVFARRLGIEFKNGITSRL